MATLEPGGYTWGGVHGGEDRYTRVVPANRQAKKIGSLDKEEI